MPHDNSPYLFIDKNGSTGELKDVAAPQPYGSLMQLFGMVEMDGYLTKEEPQATRRFMRHAISFDFNDEAQRAYLDSIWLGLS